MIKMYGSIIKSELIRPLSSLFKYLNLRGQFCYSASSATNFTFLWVPPLCQDILIISQTFFKVCEGIMPRPSHTVNYFF